MATQLSIYHRALHECRVRALESITENRQERRELDLEFSEVALYCLSQGLFRFAKRVYSLDASTTSTPQFGFNYAFDIQTDWIRTVLVSASEHMDPPLLQYREETGLLYANVTPIYHAYISKDQVYGLNVGAWPPAFVDYVVMRLAGKVCGRFHAENPKLAAALLNGSQGILKREEKAKRNAKGMDAMDDPPGLPPVPFLVRARRGAFGPGGLFIGGTGTQN
jgi:hypothetical protein